MTEWGVTRLDRYSNEQRSSTLWINCPDERSKQLKNLIPEDSQPALFGIWRLTKEIIFTTNNGSPEFKHVMFMLDARNFDLVLRPALTKHLESEEGQLKYLAFAIILQVPIYPNTIEDAQDLEHLYERLLEVGFVTDCEGEEAHFMFTENWELTNPQVEPIEALVPTRLLNPAEVMVIRRRVSARLAELKAAQSTLQKIDSAIADLERLLSSVKRNEHALQQCLARHPILFGTEYRRVLPKHRLGSEYEMDYAIERHSGFIDLVEIEASSLRLFTGAGDSTKELIHAEQQVFDWLEWMEAHGDYARVKLPRIHRPRGIVVIGRTESLTEYTARKLAQRNRMLADVLEICTYDDLLAKTKHLRDLIAVDAPHVNQLSNS